jgi:hypothetical protein
MRAGILIAIGLAAALPVAAQAACAGAGDADLCARAKDSAAAVSATLPRELAPGIRAEMAVPGDATIKLRLLVAADLRLPDAEGFAALACADPDLARLIAAGGTVGFESNRRILAVIASCPKVN